MPTDALLRGLVGVALGALFWWHGQHEQRSLRRSPWARVARPPAAIRVLCGLPHDLESVHVPMAVAQLLAITLVLAGVFIMVMAPPVTAEYRLFAVAALASVPVGYILAEGAMYIVRLLRRS